MFVAALLLELPRVVAQEALLAARFQEAMQLMDGRQDYAAAVRVFAEIEELARSQDAVLEAQALFYQGHCFEKLGEKIAREKYRRVVEEFYLDPRVRPWVDKAKQRLEKLADLSDGALVTRQLLDQFPASYLSSVSPDGRYISFADAREDLAVLDLSPREIWRAPRTVGGEDKDGHTGDSVFSRDSRQIAYAWSLAGGEFGELRVCGMGDATGRLLYSGHREVIQPVGWSGDGRRVLFLRSHLPATPEDQRMDLLWISAADGALAAVKTFETRVPGSMELSPEGRFVVYDMPPDDESVETDLFVLALDGSYEGPLVAHPAEDRFPRWTADGRRVVFLSTRSGTQDLWTIEVAEGRPSGQPQLLTKVVDHIWPLGFSQNGAFYYSVKYGESDIYAADLDPATGHVVGQPALISRRYQGSSKWPEWSPDGKSIAYLGGWSWEAVPGSAALVIVPLDKGETQEFRPKPTLRYFQRLRWHPDGHSILCMGVDGKRRGGMFLIDVSTRPGAVQTLFLNNPQHEGGWPRQAAWQSDGAAYFWHHPITRSVFLRELRSGVQQVRYDERRISEFMASPDGQWLALGWWDEQPKMAVLGVVRVGENQARELLRVPEVGTFTSNNISWTADGRHVLFTRLAPGADRHWELWRIARAGGEAEFLGLAMRGLSEIRAHGHRIVFQAFAAGKSGHDVYLVENLFAGTESIPARP